MARREELEMLGMNENNMLNVESEIGAAEQLDEAMFEELAPRGDFSKKALNNLVAAANRLLPLFEQSGDYPTFDADVDVLPTEFVRVLGMFQAAVNYAVDSGDIDEEMDFELEQITDDQSMNFLAGKINKLSKDREFKQFLQNPPPEMEEETEEEMQEEEVPMPTDEEIDSLFAARM